MNKRLATVWVVILGTAGFLAAVSLANGATRSSSTVSLHKTSVGMALVARNGHTLYLFAKDRNGRSSCTASCAKFWPPLLVSGKPTAGAGVEASLLGTTRRSNGTMQVTYNKHPLYTYLLDKVAGQTKGEGVAFFGAKWWAVSAKGVSIIKVSAPTTTTTPTTSTPPPGTTTSPYP